jgi:hypothetical protein
MGFNDCWHTVPFARQNQNKQALIYLWKEALSAEKAVVHARVLRISNAPSFAG